jgi:hypothetical protein
MRILILNIEGACSFAHFACQVRGPPRLPSPLLFGTIYLYDSIRWYKILFPENLKGRELLEEISIRARFMFKWILKGVDVRVWIAFV